MFSETIYNLDGEPRGSERRAYVLASDYDRDIADLWRQRDEARKRVAELEALIRNAALAAKEPSDE